MTPLTRLASLAVLLIATGGAPAWAGQARLGADPVIAGGEYTTGGGITVAVEPRNFGGRLGLCGVWAESEALISYLHGKSRGVLAKGHVALGGRPVLRDLGKLRQVRPRPNYAGAPATCVLTHQAWPGGAAARALKVRIPRQLVVMDRGEEGGLEVRFRQTGAANPALQSGSLLPNLLKSLNNKDKAE